MKHIAYGVLVILFIATAAMGLTSLDSSQQSMYPTHYGTMIELHGAGVYRNDTAFMAPIFIGTDIVQLALSAPLLLAVLYWHRKKHTFASHSMLVALLFVIVYYAANMAFGVMYNDLHLLYIALFGLSLCLCISEVVALDYARLKRVCQKHRLPKIGATVFMIVSSLALTAAWIPDIIASIQAPTPPDILIPYTTSVTNVLDIGVLAPAMLLSVYLMKQRRPFGIALFMMLCGLSVLIGPILLGQTLTQLAMGIDVPLPALISKVASFVILSGFGAYFYQAYLRLVNNT